MEITAMVSDLKNEMITVARELKSKEESADKYRRILKQLESEISPLRDRYDAIKMAVDALELVPTADRPAFTEEPGDGISKTKKIANLHHSRTPKRIGKFDPNGKKLCEFSSINKAAESFGWCNTSLKKYIENTSREKQIRLRGYYLDFIVS